MGIGGAVRLASKVAWRTLDVLHQMDQATLNCHRYGLDAPSYPEFGKDVVDVNLHRALHHVKSRSDFLVRLAHRHEPKDIFLSRRHAWCRHPLRKSRGCQGVDPHLSFGNSTDAGEPVPPPTPPLESIPPRSCANDFVHFSVRAKRRKYNDLRRWELFAKRRDSVS